jgi:hypothetical protein
MRRTLIALGFVAGLVAACSGSSATGGLPAGGSQPAGATQAVAATQAPAATTATAGSSVGAGNPTSGVPKTPVACSLLTSDEAAVAIGAVVNPGAGPVDPSENVCTFGGKALADMVNFVEIALVDPVEFTPTRAAIPSVFEPTPASGLGDAAYYVKSYLPNNSGTSMTLYLSKGGTIVRIDVVHHGASDSQLMAAEKTLALAALGRM